MYVLCNDVVNNDYDDDDDEGGRVYGTSDSVAEHDTSQSALLLCR